MSRFDQLLKRHSGLLNKQLGETWYVTTEGSSTFVALRVLLQEEQDRNDAVGQMVTALRNKVIVIYKDPATMIGGEAMGGLARPVIDKHQFVAEEDRGDPNAAVWVVKEILADDQLTWTLRCEQRHLMKNGIAHSATKR